MPGANKTSKNRRKGRGRILMLACGYYSLYWWRCGIARGELSAHQREAFMAHFRQQLRFLLDILACKPPDESPRSDGGAGAFFLKIY